MGPDRGAGPANRQNPIVKAVFFGQWRMVPFHAFPFAGKTRRRPPFASRYLPGLPVSFPFAQGRGNGPARKTSGHRNLKAPGSGRRGGATTFPPSPATPETVADGGRPVETVACARRNRAASFLQKRKGRPGRFLFFGARATQRLRGIGKAPIGEPKAPLCQGTPAARFLSRRPIFARLEGGERYEIQGEQAEGGPLRDVVFCHSPARHPRSVGGRDSDPCAALRRYRGLSGRHAAHGEAGRTRCCGRTRR